MNNTFNVYPSQIGNEIFGAYVAGSSIKDCTIVLHSGKGCIETNVNKMALLFNRDNILFSRYVTALTDNYIIDGSSKYLEEVLDKVCEKDSNNMIFVLNNYIPIMIGDDFEGVIHKYTSREIVSITCNVDNNEMCLGFNKALNSIVKTLVPQDSQRFRRSNKDGIKKICIWGLIPLFDIYYYGNCIELRRIFESLDMEVIYISGENVRRKDLRNIVKADLNIVLSSDYCIDIVKYLEEKFDIPYVRFDGYAIGLEQVSNYLNVLVKKGFLNSEAVKNFLEKERRLYFERIGNVMRKLEAYIGVNVGITGMNEYIKGLESFLQELCLKVKIKTITNLNKDKNSFFEINNEYYKKLKEMTNKINSEVEIVFGSSMEKSILQGSKCKFVHLSSPNIDKNIVLPKPYIGILGALSIIEDIIN